MAAAQCPALVDCSCLGGTVRGTGEQLQNSGHQLSIFSRIGNQQGAISDPDLIVK